MARIQDVDGQLKRPMTSQSASVASMSSVGALIGKHENPSTNVQRHNYARKKVEVRAAKAES